MASFVVLKRNISAHTTSPFENFGVSTQSTTGLPQPSVEVHDVSVEAASTLATHPDVAAIGITMPVALIKPADAGPATPASDVWGIGAVKADVSSCTGAGAVVAVLDTGIDKTHPAFDGMEIIEQDFTGSGNGDRHGHGTHAAATIFGRPVDGKRVGVAPGVKKALIGKVLDDAGGGSSDMVFQGIQWALNQGVHVISMSLGFDFPGAAASYRASGVPELAAISNALEAYRSNLRFFDTLLAFVQAKAAFGETPVIVAACGNEAHRPNYSVAASLPSAAKGVISVGALGQGGGQLTIAAFSNTLPQLVAPGVNIVSAKAGGGVATMSGTSMACPHVAGVAALWWESLRKSGTVTPSADAVVNRMIATARVDHVLPGTTTIDRGNGLVTAPE